VLRQIEKSTSYFKADIVHSLLRIDATGLSKVSSVKLFRLNGDIVKTKTLRTVAGQNISVNIELSDLSNGFYILQLSSSKDVIYSSKIAVTK
jgi:heme/copper-type cytochrome/quinol oxidase subunit 2